MKLIFTSDQLRQAVAHEVLRQGHIVVIGTQMTINFEFNPHAPQKDNLIARIEFKAPTDVIEASSGVLFDATKVGS